MEIPVTTRSIASPMAMAMAMERLRLIAFPGIAPALTSSICFSSTATAGSATDTITFTITAPVSVSVEITSEATEVEVGSTLQLAATVLGTENTAVTWSTRDEAVATVSETGLVTGVKAGTTTITATSQADSTKSDSIEITVKDVDYSIGQITTEGETYTVRGVVDAKTTKGLVLTDGTDSVYVYLNKYSTDYNIGDALEVTGEIGSFNKAFQFTADAEITPLDGETFTAAEPTALTAEIANSWKSAESFSTSDIKEYTWTTALAKDGSYWVAPIEGSDTVIEPVYVPSEFESEFKEGCIYNITAYFGGYYSYASMYVTAAEFVSAPTLESITINGADSVYVGSTTTLTAQLNPTGASGEVTWTSSDDEVATVSADGVVTGVTEGEVTITAAVGEITATKTITVTQPTGTETLGASIDLTVLTGNAELKEGAIGTQLNENSGFTSGTGLTLTGSTGESKAYAATGSNTQDEYTGIKLGTSSASGTFTLTFGSSINIAKVVLTDVHSWSGKTVSLAVNGVAQELTIEKLQDVEYAVTGETTTLTITTTKVNDARAIIGGIEIYVLA